MDWQDIVPKALEVHALGDYGEMEVLPQSEELLSTSRLPCGIPPILPDIKTTLESYLVNMENLPILSLDNVQRFIPCEPNIPSLYTPELCAMPTELTVKRNMETGKLLGFVEKVKEKSSGTAKTSTSMTRAPGAPDFGVTGSSSSFPFWPGGLEDPLINILAQDPVDTTLFDGDLLETPPGFERGMHFERQNPKVDILEELPIGKISLTDLLHMDDSDFPLFEKIESQEDTTDNMHTESSKEFQTSEPDDFEIRDLPVLNISEAPTKIPTDETEYSWAIMDRIIPVPDFDKQIPNLAIEHSFKLDPFQQRAILHLEKQESVFVAAHTSSGKTVVAEYAIALSKKHMTRVIYTSPIKALSNQKFRDFKVLFNDVGLITGDIVINPTAFCLIMTTEILRSMLYHGSDVIREVEWVIFDEVHYINDAERGVVWEEVFIMLPQHVNLIMLSATVPNASEFAEWLGGIKKQKIYVITTAKRPVPLEYHLYTGSVGLTQDDLFCIVDSSMKFIDHNYTKACDARKEKDKRNKTGSKGPQYLVMQAQEKNIYIGLLGLLKKKDLLPVICFTFSRKGCARLADILKSQDLTTAKEKAKIKRIFENSIEKLKPEDRNLRQIRIMRDQLVQGFGVHHSGILPILKEVVEILFKDSLVKVLFATETFAMGVNMPARTVVFDSLQKHDGKTLRNLYPSEFIQMAGRAGRRNHDKIGTVVVLCKRDIPDSCLLHEVMLGKITKLQSQFKLTYNMILNLLKVKTLRVEDMMKRSFVECDKQKERVEKQLLLTASTEKLANLERPECSLCATDLQEYCSSIQTLKKCQKEVMEKVATLAMNSKDLAPGRVISFETAHHPNVPGIVLSIKDKKCRVLSISSSSDAVTDSVPFTKKLYFPDNQKLLVVTISLEDIRSISNKTFKHLRCDDILKAWVKVEHMNAKPSHDLTSAFEDLCSFVEQSRSGFSSANLRFRDMNLANDYKHLQTLQNSLEQFKCIQCPDFSNHLSSLLEITQLEKDIENCQFKMSEESLEFHQEYRCRKEVLKNMGYIDSKDHVHLKGSVAREISNHELLITELLVHSVFNDCDSEDIAALLSCMVVQQRSNMEKDLNLPSKLRHKASEIQNVIESIDCQQKKCCIDEPNFCDQYNFFLAPIVYDWARGVTFSEIMDNCKVEVEEGIVVRCIQRLCELLKEVKNAANLVGDVVCSNKMADASKLIKRDIVFAASLYTQ